jgi:FAD/FMN-containing dehydrogenase
MGPQLADAELITLDEAEVRRLEGGLRGHVVRPADPVYDEARAVFNAMIDRRPALIVRCAGVGDVIEAVRFARRNGLELAVRGGGHNVTGYAVSESGLVADLSPMKGVWVDLERGTARVQAGLTWAEVNHELQRFGLGATGGVIGTTGVSGLTLGGGLGWLVRKHGLACDNLLSIDVVTADGEFVRASETENNELFWGMRGGGGNFGIATSFEFRVHPVGTVLAGLLAYPIEAAGDFLRAWRDFEATAPEEWTAGTVLLTAPPAPFVPEPFHGRQIVALAGVYAGAIEEGEALLRPLRELGRPAVDLIRPMPYSAAQTMIDPLYPPGLQNYWKAQFLSAVEDGLVDTLLARFAEVPSPMTQVILEHNGDGAVNRVQDDATAFGWRDHSYILIVMSLWPERADSDRNIAWTRRLYEAASPFTRRGVYVNYLGAEGADRVKEAYGEKYGRLIALKAKYDPTNVFHLNQNIPPS